MELVVQIMQLMVKCSDVRNLPKYEHAETLAKSNRQYPIGDFCMHDFCCTGSSAMWQSVFACLVALPTVQLVVQVATQETPHQIAQAFAQH